MQRCIGILVDAENVGSPSLVIPIVNLAQDSGTIRTLALFGNWNSPTLQQWKSDEFIKRLQQWGAVWSPTPKTRPGKNCSDIAIAFEAAVLCKDRIDEIWLASGDSDFTPAVQRLIQRGIAVRVFGRRNSLDCLKTACTSFVALEDIETGFGARFNSTRTSNVAAFPTERVQASVQQIVQKLHADKAGNFLGFVKRVGARFGFIQVNDSDSIFFHESNLDHPANIRDLKPGDQVRFQLGQNGRGAIAVHVHKLLAFNAN